VRHRRSYPQCQPNTDLERDEDYVPYYDNHADIHGEGRIDSKAYELPRIEDTDHPQWETLGPHSCPASHVRSSSAFAARARPDTSDR
jgi:hypothetical protein